MWIGQKWLISIHEFFFFFFGTFCFFNIMYTRLTQNGETYHLSIEVGHFNSSPYLHLRHFSGFFLNV